MTAPNARTSCDYSVLARTLAATIPQERLQTDPLHTLAYSSDGSLYRLTPQIVVTVCNETEVLAVLAACHQAGAPITFRASGTSLSGQAISDSVLMLLGEGWNGVRIDDGAAAIHLQPGVIGAEANRRLAAFARKIGPDPASIDSAKIGGIAANNSSGMCCGTADNSYQTLISMRLILADGTVVDTGDEASATAFRRSHAGLLQQIEDMGAQVRADAELSARIRSKYAIKNTNGYALNSLVDFTDPLDILQHLLIGSEGTLGFISEITYRTVPEHAHKASALLLFPTIVEACRALPPLRQAPTAAVELLDRAALRAVEDKPGMPPEILGLPDGSTALLVETRAESAEALEANIASICQTLAAFTLMTAPAFTDQPEEYGRLWKIRKGLFPAVGAVRKTGTTVITEDVAFKLTDLAEAIEDLQHLFAQYGYHDAIIVGHARDGNLHFIFTQDFGIASEVERYGAFMDAICHLVVDKYNGSLKAEHGTGRNMTPFVELEWGATAYGMMRRIKDLLDPKGLLNPGVMLDNNPTAHLSNLKPMPAAHPLVDSCIECGFCERMCPSAGLTLTPRHRIVGWREISRLARSGDDEPRRQELTRLYAVQGIDTCAACGLCSTACPVGINTGRMIKALRHDQLGTMDKLVGGLAARHFGPILAGARAGLTAGRIAKAVTGGAFPTIAASLPRPGKVTAPTASEGMPVVYLPSCANRAFGSATDAPESDGLATRMVSLLEKAGFRVILPDNLSNLCCGQAFESRGMFDLANAKSSEVEAALLTASDQGQIPVLMDASACTLRLKQVLDKRLTVLDSIEFLHDHVLPRLDIRKETRPVLLHVNCSARRMGLEGKLQALAQACADQVVVPHEVGCCGFAGDKGYTVPQLNAHALRHLPEAVPADAEGGYSSNRTCEIGLSDHSGKPYRSIAYLLDRVSHRRKDGAS